MPKNTSTRRNKSVRIVRRVYSPVSHFLQLTSNAVGTATNTARNIVQRSIKAVNGVGSSIANHTNTTIHNVTHRSRSARRSGGSRTARSRSARRNGTASRRASRR